jgi:Tol biopolymer transport system component
MIRVSTGKAHAIGNKLIGQNGTWGPNGETLAFHYGVELAANPYGASWRGIAIAGTHGKNLTALTRLGDNPDWSPDGTRIAFGSDGIRTVDARRHVVVLARTGNHPNWSPDGSRIVFERGGDLWVMDSNGGHQHLLVRRGSAPDWSPL